MIGEISGLFSRAIRFLAFCKQFAPSELIAAVNSQLGTTVGLSAGRSPWSGFVGGRTDRAHALLPRDVPKSCLLSGPARHSIGAP